MINFHGLIVVRQLVREKEACETYRIVHVEQRGFTWLCNINDDSWPFRVSRDFLLRSLDSGEYEIVESDPWMHVLANDFVVEKSVLIPATTKKKEEPKADAYLRERWMILTKLTENGQVSQLLYSNRRGFIVDQTARQFGRNTRTVRKILKLWWKRGMCPGALSTDYDKCGAKGVLRIPSEIKRGASRRVSVGVGVNADEVCNRIFRIAADYWLDSRPLVTLRDAHDYIVKLFFSDISCEIPSKELRVVINTELPTKRQLEYYIKREYTKQEIARRRSNKHHYELHMRGLTGAGDQHVFGPGDQFAIDATIADIYLRSQFDRRRIVGRPIIYFVIDVWSRLVTGLYVGFEGPSWVGATMALVNMVTPKVSFCEAYGINIVEEQWPSHHAPKSILADRAELLSTANGRRITLLNIDVQNTGAWRADMKAIVERRFGIIPAIWRPFTPGYVEKDFNERGAIDYRVKSVLTLREFAQILIRSVLQYNNSPIKNIIVPGLIYEGGDPSPLDLWRWGVQNRSGLLHTISIDRMALAVMPRVVGRVTSHGILVNGAFYSCDIAMREDWYSLARSKEWAVDIAYDPRDLGIAYIEGKKIANGCQRLTLLPKSEWLDSRSLFEFGEMKTAQQLQQSAHELARQEQRIKFQIENKEIADRAAEAVAATGILDESANSQTNDIRKNRKQEKALQRSSEKFDLTAKCAPSDQQTLLADQVGNSDSAKEKIEKGALMQMRKLKQSRVNRK